VNKPKKINKKRLITKKIKEINRNKRKSKREIIKINKKIARKIIKN